MKSKIKILIIALGIIWATLWIETRIQSEYKDPFKVSKNFAYGLLIENKHIMKEWSGNKELDIKIDNLFKTDDGSYEESHDSYVNFYLSGWSNLFPFIICTYSIETSDDNGHPYVFCYTVELEAKRSLTLWEKLREIVYDIPLIGKQFSEAPNSKPKWIVKDFYNKDSLATWSNESEKKSERDLKIFLKLSEEERKKQEEKEHKEEEKNHKNFLNGEWPKMINIISDKERDNWLTANLIKQNEETKSLLIEYNQVYTTPYLKHLEKIYGQRLILGGKKK